MIRDDFLKYFFVLRRWWRESEIAQLNFYRIRHVEFVFWAATCISEPEFSQSRIALAQVCVLATVLDDFYDTHGLLDELKTTTEAVRRWIQIIQTLCKLPIELFLVSQNIPIIYFLRLLYILNIFNFITVCAIFRWDLSLIDDLPDPIKIVFRFFFKTANELADQIVKVQKRDMAATLKCNSVCV